MGLSLAGVQTGRGVTNLRPSRMTLERSAEAGDSPVDERAGGSLRLGSQVLRDTGNPVGIRADHGLRLNTPSKPIVHKYREGKLKRTAVSRVK